jgi:hypothetical protein
MAVVALLVMIGFLRGKTIREATKGPDGDLRSQKRRHEVTVEPISTGQKVILVIVAVSCLSVGADALLTGEFFSMSQSGPTMHLEGWGAYIAGAVFIGVGALAAFSLFRR